jgi:hypothetical protein
MYSGYINPARNGGVFYLILPVITLTGKKFSEVKIVARSVKPTIFTIKYC